MSAQPIVLISEEEYLEMEISSPFKSEYFKGEVFAMAGGTQVHNNIAINLTLLIGNFLKNKKCRLYSSDMKIFVPKYPYYTYPDLSIVCNKPEYSPLTDHAITNPSVIIEVLSKSTENYDKTTKFGLFRQIPSLQEFVLVSSLKHHVEIYHRFDVEVWEQTADATKLEHTVLIKEIELEITLAEIYENTDLLENKIDFKR